MFNPSTKIMELLLKPSEGFAYWGFFDDFQKDDSGFAMGNWIGSNVPFMAYEELQLNFFFFWIEYSTKHAEKAEEL